MRLNYFRASLTSGYSIRDDSCLSIGYDGYDDDGDEVVDRSPYANNDDCDLGDQMNVADC